MKEYNDLKIDYRLLKSNSKGFDLDKIKEYCFNNFKDELKNYKEKCNNLMEENNQLRQSFVDFKKQNEKLHETYDLLKHIKIINQEANSEDEENKNTAKIPIINKTIEDLGNGKVVESIQIITEEESLRGKNDEELFSKPKKTNKSSKSTRSLIKISKLDEKKNEEEAPDSEFLRKIKKYSRKEPNEVNDIIRKSARLNKVKFRDTAGKNKSKKNISKFLDNFKSKVSSDNIQRKETNIFKTKTLKIKNAFNFDEEDEKEAKKIYDKGSRLDLPKIEEHKKKELLGKKDSSDEDSD